MARLLRTLLDGEWTTSCTSLHDHYVSGHPRISQETQYYWQVLAGHVGLDEPVLLVVAAYGDEPQVGLERLCDAEG